MYVNRVCVFALIYFVLVRLSPKNICFENL